VLKYNADEERPFLGLAFRAAMFRAFDDGFGIAMQSDVERTKQVFAAIPSAKGN